MASSGSLVLVKVADFRSGKHIERLAAHRNDTERGHCRDARFFWTRERHGTKQNKERTCSSKSEKFRARTGFLARRMK